MNSAPPLPDFRLIARDAFNEVLASWLSLTATEESPANSDPTSELDSIIHTVIQLRGTLLSGEVRLLVPRRFAETAFSALAPTGHRIGDAELDDFCGEFANMVAGRVAERLGRAGYPCLLSAPQIVWRRGDELTPAETASCVRTAWNCQNHRLSLEIESHFGRL